MGRAKFPIRKIIRIQRLQTKNRMVGQTFNPSGITSEQIAVREKTFIREWSAKTKAEREEYWANVQSMLKMRRKENLYFSWPWEWCAFQRAFVLHNNEII